MRGFLVVCLAFVSALSWAQVKCRIQPEDLRCESQVAPIAIDVANPRLSWILRAESGALNQRQTGYRVLVASTRAKLDRGVGDLWDSGRVASAQQNQIVYSGKRLSPLQTAYWKVQVWDGSGSASRWSNSSKWDQSIRQWVARWLDDGKPLPATPDAHYRDDPAPLFRKEWRSKSLVRKARLFVTGIGYYEATINGHRVGDHVLEPGWTNYAKRVFYSAYDVTKLIAEGANAMGVTVGNGWYNPLPLKMWGRLDIREHLPVGRPRFIAQLEIEYQNGNRETIASGPDWRVAEGPIVRNSVYLGEVYDARLEQPGWDRPGFDDSSWRLARIAGGQLGNLRSQPLPPIRAIQRWHPRSVVEPKPGVFIYDCGENFSGWITVDATLPKGTRVIVRYGELVRQDGSLNPMTSVAGQIKRAGTGGPGAPDVAWQGDVFVAGEGKTWFSPKFGFRGFRYVELTGVDKPLPLSALTAVRLSTDVDDSGAFECSDPTLNQIQAICRRTFRSNLFSVQSDCPHREKMGYGGDIVATCEALMLNYDMAAFYAKTVSDFGDAVRPEGMLTDTAPFMGIQYCGVVWAMAHPLLIDRLYRYYGDTRIAEQQYEVAKRWLLKVESETPDGIVSSGLSDHEGLDEMPSDAMVTLFYIQSARLLGGMARRLGKASDARHFDALAKRSTIAYSERLVKSGVVGPGTQASQSIGLATGLVGPEGMSRLLSEIDQKNGHLSTGILGTRFMLDELSKAGRSDLAHQIVVAKGFPGWRWMLDNGATTLWEHWEFSDNTFSHNHPMFGSVSEWMMKWLGGIQPADDAIGFNRIAIRPRPVAGIDWVKSSYRSVRGRIVSNWKRVGDKVEYSIVIPPNCEAEVDLVGSQPHRIGSGAHKFISPPLLGK